MEVLTLTKQDFMLREWLTIRRAGAEHEEVQRVQNGHWSFIREGLYKMWYYRFYTGAHRCRDRRPRPIAARALRLRVRRPTRTRPWWPARPRSHL